LRLGQQVALKFLPESLATDGRRLAQFHNEVRTARQVSHPNVCRVYDIGELHGQMFLTMEYVDGEDLSILLRRIGRLPEERAIEIARQMCAGLAAAHERGILHRDLKPANIMLDGSGKVRIMDFSLAAIGQVEDIRAGTPAYMAPEQLSGLEVTVRSDIYALGLVLYEVFTGRRAFEAKTIADLVAQHQSGVITSPMQLVASLDQVVDRAIMRCLDPEPSRRPTSALAVAASLPGGDPLAAALAAGETPSPEMVAAAGGQGATLSATAGALWLAAFAVLLFASLWIADRGSLLSKVPLTKSGEVLVDRAEEIRQSLGYNEPVVDRRSSFSIQHGVSRVDREEQPGG
jgi:serine/threonine-protein kinase